MAHKGHLDIFDRHLVTRDRELLSRDRKYRGVPCEPPYVWLTDRRPKSPGSHFSLSQPEHFAGSWTLARALRNNFRVGLAMQSDRWYNITRSVAPCASALNRHPPWELGSHVTWLVLLAPVLFCIPCLVFRMRTLMALARVIPQRRCVCLRIDCTLSWSSSTAGIWCSTSSK